MLPFVHLRVHSEFSLEDGLIRVSDLTRLAAEDHQPAVAVTDLSRMFNTINFYEAARKNGIKPIVGVDVWVEPDVTVDGVDPKPFRMLLLSQNLVGYRRLMDWTSRSYLENQRRGIPAIKQSWMVDEGTEGLIGLSGDGATGEIARALLDTSVPPADSAKNALGILAFYQSVFPDRFYLEVQRSGHAYETEFVTRIVGMARHTGVPLVATHPIQFKEREDFFAHEVRVSIAEGTEVDSINHTVAFTREQHFKTQAEMRELFQDLPEAIANAGEIARRCALDIPLRTNSLPQFDTPNGEDLPTFFIQQSQEGLQQRLLALFPDPIERQAKQGAYQERLTKEVNTINEMGFTGYFLIVSDFIRWAKERDILVGPGRGSGAGSLVAYALKITDMDPLKYNLLFERFLNPERVSMPDFDIDFEATRREEVIRYVKDTYGENSVAQIAAGATFATRAALKYTGKSLQVPPLQIQSLLNCMPDHPGSLQDLVQDNAKFSNLYHNDDRLRRLVDVAMRLEGAPSHMSKHASGLLIAPGKLTDFTPLYVAENGDGVISQYDKDQVEIAGLVKFDFLGINVLSILQQTVQLVNQRPERQGNRLVIENIPLDDAEVFKNFAKGNTVGIFQFESSGMQNLLRKANPDRFEDLIALNALYRPGPMELIPDFVSRKNGAAFDYPDPRTEAVLKETYGVMVYQEQVMQMAQIVGGYSLGGADLLRRAMGKKKPEEMAKHRAIFREGAAKNGVLTEKADEIFDLMEKFAGYGFNKSHAAAYALQAYQMAYLKTHHPSEYYASIVNVWGVDESENDRVQVLLKDAKANGVRVLPPDINTSSTRFVPLPNGEILYGLGALKGMNAVPMQNLEEVRATVGPFTSLMDFCQKLGPSRITKGPVETLVRAGAFDSLNTHRASLLASVPEAMAFAGKMAKKVQASGAMLPELFGAIPKKPSKTRSTANVDASIVEPMLLDVPRWDVTEQLIHEKTAIGFYMTAHPFDGFKQKLGGLQAALPLSHVEHVDGRQEESWLVCGLLTHMKVHTITKQGPLLGRQMLFAAIDDGLTEHEITVFPDLYDQMKDRVKVGDFTAFEAKIKADNRNPDNGNTMGAEGFFTFEDLQQRLAQGVNLAVHKERLNDVQALLEQHPGPLSVVLFHPSPDDANSYIRAPLNNAFSVSGSPECLQALQSFVGPDRLALSYHKEIVFAQRLKVQRRPRSGP